MDYEAWRISYQSSEQAARAAFAECERLRKDAERLRRIDAAMRSLYWQDMGDCVEIPVSQWEALELAMTTREGE